MYRIYWKLTVKTAERLSRFEYVFLQCTKFDIFLKELLNLMWILTKDIINPIFNEYCTHIKFPTFAYFPSLLRVLRLPNLFCWHWSCFFTCFIFSQLEIYVAVFFATGFLTLHMILWRLLQISEKLWQNK